MKRTLVITDRKCQSRAQAQKLEGYYCAQEPDAQEAKYYKCVVVEFENLHWLADLEPEYIILGNMRTLLNATVRTPKNRSILVKMMQGAKVTEPTDADMKLDPIVSQFALNVFGPAHVELHKYKE